MPCLTPKKIDVIKTLMIIVACNKEMLLIFQGVEDLHKTSWIPHKRSKNNPMTAEQKRIKKRRELNLFRTLTFPNNIYKEHFR
jgi:hypothetical protein